MPPSPIATRPAFAGLVLTEDGTHPASRCLEPVRRHVLPDLRRVPDPRVLGDVDICRQRLHRAMAQRCLKSRPNHGRRGGRSAPVITKVLSGMESHSWPVCTMRSEPWVTCAWRVGCVAIQLGAGMLPPLPACLPFAQAATRPGVTRYSAIAAQWTLIESKPSPMENRLVLRAEPAATALCH